MASGTTRFRLSRTLAAALYCLVVLAASFEHHDVICHIRNPLHCTACTASLPGSDPQALATPRTFQLADAGRAVTVHLTARGALLVVRSTGRSPPRIA